MFLKHKSCTGLVRRNAIHLALIAFFIVPQTSGSETLTLNKNGPKTAYEGESIEYRLEVVNEGALEVQGATVREMLPAELKFVDATPTLGGIYDPISGVWTLPALGTSASDNTAGLRLQVLVGQNLVAVPSSVATAINQAEIITPTPPQPVKAKATTNIVCAFCIDWEITSVKSDSDFRLRQPDSYETRFIYHVQIANNGPIASVANVSATHFDIIGGGFGAVALLPDMPVAVSLEAGKTSTVTFATDWAEGPDSTYTVSWKFEVSDESLQDPVKPNTVQGSFTGQVENGGGGGGCSVSDSTSIDPIWLLLFILLGGYYVKRYWAIGEQIES